MTKKITKRDNYNTLLAIKEVAENPQLVEFINHEIELLSKKNGTSKGLTPTQKENEDIKLIILEGLNTEEFKSISEVQKSDSRLAEYSNQKLSALFKQLVDTGVITRTEIKRKAYFKAN